jgi:stress response protein YsnF
MTLESKDDQDPLDHVVVPLHEEQVRIEKREVVTDRVKVSTRTHSQKELMEQLLRKERVEIERVPMGQIVQEVPQVREEGDVTIIPVMRRRARASF